MDVRPARGRRDLRRFVELPYRLHRADACWVPPLRREERRQLDPRHNRMLDHCEHELFLLWEGDEVVGRISAFVDHAANRHWGRPIGLFGSYECVDADAGAHALLATAREWLRDRGMETMRGPWSFASQEFGLLVEGFDRPNVIMAPHNPPYYARQLEGFGLEGRQDMLAWEADLSAGYRIPPRYLRLTDAIARRYRVRVRPVDVRRLEEDVTTITRVGNEALKDNWGYYPVPEAEGRALARDMRPIMDPELVLLAEDDRGEAIGFCIVIPDVNVLLAGMDGRLLPFGWLRLLLRRRHIDRYRVWALGVLPGWQGRGIDALLYRRLNDRLGGRPVRLEVNYVLDDNVRMTNVIDRMGLEVVHRYRVYEMAIR